MPRKAKETPPEAVSAAPIKVLRETEFRVGVDVSPAPPAVTHLSAADAVPFRDRLNAPHLEQAKAESDNRAASLRTAAGFSRDVIYVNPSPNSIVNKPVIFS